MAKDMCGIDGCNEVAIAAFLAFTRDESASLKACWRHYPQAQVSTLELVKSMRAVKIPARWDVTA